MPPDFSRLGVTVLGSVNLDLVARISRFPQPGETITDATIQRCPGGKGANQALAARRLGARVELLACVGEDAMADEALSNLRAAGVGLDGCRRLKDTATGLALIQVIDSGENQIVVAPGANAAFRPELLNLPQSDLLIAQLEVPVETVLAAAGQHDGLFCLNAAPVRPFGSELLRQVDLLVVNDIEAAALEGVLKPFEGLMAVTHGAEGATLFHQGRERARARPPRVRVIDTTGAGDAFTAALAIAIAAGLPHQEALELACRVGALTATGSGAQSSPRFDELDIPD